MCGSQARSCGSPAIGALDMRVCRQFDGPSSAAPEVWYSGFRAATLSAFKRISDRSFYRLVGTAEQCGRDGNAESLCGLEVDEQVNFRGLLDR